MTSLDFAAFDADNHYYEALDAFTRHLEKGFAARTMQWAEVGGKQRLLVGGKVNRFIPDPAYRDRDARLARMDRQGLDGAFFFPTLAVGMEQPLMGDPEALMAAFRAFNRWLEEDWGFAYQERIFAAPYIPLVDVDNAVAELEWALEREVRVIIIGVGPVVTASGGRAPSDPIYDPFRANPLRSLLSHDPVHDTVAAMLADQFFFRFPNIRVASIELGSAWAFHLFEKLKKTWGQAPFAFPEDPRETFRRHVWVSPFYEDDLRGLRDLVGVDRILMGSDWPHAEGLAEPASFIDDLRREGYDDAEAQTIMRDNGLALSRTAALQRA